MTQLPIATAIDRLTAMGRWPRRPDDWAVEDAECDATLLRVYAGRTVNELSAYLRRE
jgi:hypothetical protein